MKKKILASGLLVSALSMALLFPKAGAAFWPFDGWFQRGEVKGEQTEVSRPGLIKTIRQRVNPTPTPTTSTENLEKGLTEDKMNKAVKGNVISEANKKAMLAKLAEIKKRREELKKLQEEFMAWMKANKIDPKMIEGGEKTGTTETTEKTETTTTPATGTQRVTPTIFKPAAR